MNEVTVANFRCFSEKQTVRLAPLTLLVGENSTGKTSFLALVRALWDVAIQEQLPDFKEPPYDLGTFDEIAHFRGGRGGRAETFEVGCLMGPANGGSRKSGKQWLRYDFTFRRDGSGVVPSVRRIGNESAWVECRIADNGTVSVGIETRRGKWEFTSRHIESLERFAAPAAPFAWKSQQRDLPQMGYLIRTLLLWSLKPPELDRFEIDDGNVSPPGKEDLKEISKLQTLFWRPSWRTRRPFSSAPVRSRPRRTYDPSQATLDPEGEHVPMLLATIARNDGEKWDYLKKSLEEFGKSAGLFDEIRIKGLGGKAGGPFQVLVRRWGKHAKGPYRNLIDMGYGVSQALPMVAELLHRPKSPQIFLLQQPEVHLHPSAQAALGEFFARIASKIRQPIIVETHSDHLIDRIRMNVRDGRTKLNPDDVSILYFERRNLAVTIHSLGWDDNGNLVAKRGSIPDSYRQFFRTERRRSLGLFDECA